MHLLLVRGFQAVAVFGKGGTNPGEVVVSGNGGGKW